MNQTLYISDLDGTLMRNNQTLSEKTIQTINHLTEKGIAFSYATARSIQSAHKITRDLNLTLPVITRNGCVLADNTTCRILEKSIFSDEDVIFLKNHLPELSHYGFVSSYEDSEMYKTYCGEDLSYGLQKYIQDHSSDHRMRKCNTIAGLFQGVIGYVTMIDDRKILEPVYEKLRTNPRLECVFQKDTYGEEYWLEICPENSTKAKAILKLKELFGFDKLVVFGDSVNDLSMFHIADEAYAVSNAAQEVRAAATGVIGSSLKLPLLSSPFSRRITTKNSFFYKFIGKIFQLLPIKTRSEIPLIGKFFPFSEINGFMEAFRAQNYH